MNAIMNFQQQRGMSLVELMIAMLLGTMLIAGAVKIFSSNSQALRLQQQVSSVQETARYRQTCVVRGKGVLWLVAGHLSVDGMAGMLPEALLVCWQPVM